MTTREFLQLLQHRVHLVVLLLAFPALHGLVLVAELVELELEEVSQVLRVGTAAAAAALLLKGHVLLVRLLGSLHVLERLLLVRQGALYVL